MVKESGMWPMPAWVWRDVRYIYIYIFFLSFFRDSIHVQLQHDAFMCKERPLPQPGTVCH